jgi:hypothetical protein
MAFNQRPSSSYQPCDTFFVESCNDANRRPDPQEHTKLIARERQYAIADQLSTLAKEEYLDDCLSHMLQMDVRCSECLSRRVEY